MSRGSDNKPASPAWQPAADCVRMISTQTGALVEDPVAGGNCRRVFIGTLVIGRLWSLEISCDWKALPTKAIYWPKTAADCEPGVPAEDHSEAVSETRVCKPRGFMEAG